MADPQDLFQLGGDSDPVLEDIQPNIARLFIGTPEIPVVDPTDVETPRFAPTSVSQVNDLNKQAQGLFAQANQTYATYINQVQELMMQDKGEKGFVQGQYFVAQAGDKAVQSRVNLWDRYQEQLTAATRAHALAKKSGQLFSERQSSVKREQAANERRRRAALTPEGLAERGRLSTPTGDPSVQTGGTPGQGLPIKSGLSIPVG